MADDEVTYLYDGLYVSYDGHQLRLIADLAGPAQQSVYVDPRAWAELRRYAAGTIEADESPLQRALPHDEREQRMFRTAARLERGEDISAQPWSVTRARLGLDGPDVEGGAGAVERGE